MRLSDRDTLGRCISWHYFSRKIVRGVLSCDVMCVLKIFSLSYKDILRIGISIFFYLMELIKLFHFGNRCDWLTILTCVVVFWNCLGAFASFMIESLVLLFCYYQIDATVKSTYLNEIVFLFWMIGIKVSIVFKVGEFFCTSTLRLVDSSFGFTECVLSHLYLENIHRLVIYLFVLVMLVPKFLGYHFLMQLHCKLFMIFLLKNLIRVSQANKTRP